jgi:tetratricopeptide (TPR) repeat protein
MKMKDLEQFVSTYKDALDALPQQGDSDAMLKIMKLLISRDELASALARGGCESVSALINIDALDERLRNAAVTIDEVAGRSTLANWRQSIHPIESPWWWNLDERAAAAEPGRNPLWTIPAALFLALSLSVMADTITTLKNGGLNRLSVLGTFMQGLLALLVGSTFLTGVSEWLEKLFTKMNLNRKFQGRSRVVLAATVLALTFAINLELPVQVARYRNHEGDLSFKNKEYQDAAENYRQALALEPSLAAVHFHLALSSDRIRDYPNAISEYERGVETDPNNYIAANNLARLYILQARNYGGALRHLNYWIKNLERVPVGVHYALFKNRGWVNFESKNLVQAKDDLETAIKKNSDGAAAHYLLGRVFEELGDQAKARQQWDQFMEIVTRRDTAVGGDERLENDIEPDWVAHAHEQLVKGDVK